MAHLVKHRTRRIPINYLDDYLFVAFLRSVCNEQMQAFLLNCEEIGFPVSMEKTVWAVTSLTFLGMLIDALNQSVNSIGQS